MSLGVTISRQYQKELQNRTYKDRIIIFSSWKNYHFFDSQASVALTSSFCHWWSNTNCSFLSSMLKGSCLMGKKDLSQDHVFRVTGQGDSWKNQTQILWDPSKAKHILRFVRLSLCLVNTLHKQLLIIFLFMPSKALSTLNTKVRWTNENKSQSPALGGKTRWSKW